MDYSKLDYPTRVAINGPTVAIYSGSNIPHDDDPGWQDGQDAESGRRVRLIEVHGPFAVRGLHGPEERCEDGWLAVTENGDMYAVDSVYDEAETAHPLGHVRQEAD